MTCHSDLLDTTTIDVFEVRRFADWCHGEPAEFTWTLVCTLCDEDAGMGPLLCDSDNEWRDAIDRHVHVVPHPRHDMVSVAGRAVAL